jgi:tetrahydrodipicolinate N-succinyltransferase
VFDAFSLSEPVSTSLENAIISTARAVIVKPVDERTRAKISINELLRD